MALMISTTENPFDPRTDLRAWDEWDRAHGFNTSAYLDRVAALPDDLPDALIDTMRDDAILEIIAIHGGEIYIALAVDEDESPKTTTAA